MKKQRIIELLKIKLMLTLETNIKNFYGVGATLAKRLAKLDIATVRDLLFYFPFRYDDFRTITSINNLTAGITANIIGQIELIQNKRSPRKRIYITEALIRDQTGQIKVIWFNQPFIAKNLKIGEMVSLAGKIETDYSGLVMVSPIYEKITSRGAVHTQGLVPNYHLTAGITQKQIRALIKRVIPLADKIPDWLPEFIIKKQNLLTLPQAIKKIHFPTSFIEVKKARERLAFNELFLLQIQSFLVKKELKSFFALPIKFQPKPTKDFVSSLGFKLTNDQRRAAWEILQDMEKEKPMARLLEGDVGSGKTVVAAIALFNVALNNRQGVLMAPTEILAAQHFSSLQKMFVNFNLNLVLLTRGSKTFFECRPNKQKEKKLSKPKILKKIKTGEANIIIGTHTLIQEEVQFKNLALVVVDEQHRFGVAQRKALIEKMRYPDTTSKNSSPTKTILPHFLSMTATPIPRSLALALYGDLDISLIKEMPHGRKKIKTYVIPEEKREKAYQFIREQIKIGRQVFVICPLIDISDKLGIKSVKEEYKKLNEEVFPDLPIGLLHGRLPTREKEKIMADFLADKIKILVSTSVVEVGVDVPNATIMMIEGAERFGLAQLHQFRGRVGRGEHQSYCFLFTDSQTEKTLQRLEALVKYQDGFELAKIDLQLRGPGEIYGTAQKGFPDLKIATLLDYDLIKKTRTEAQALIANDPELINAPQLKKLIKQIAAATHLE